MRFSRWLRGRHGGLTIRTRRTRCGFAPAEYRIHEARRTGPRVPAQPQHRHLHVLAPERERFLTVPHVEIEHAHLNLGTGLYDRVYRAVHAIVDCDDDISAT